MPQHHTAGEGFALHVVGAGSSEVQHMDATTRVEQHVVGLDVAVEHTEGLAVWLHLRPSAVEHRSDFRDDVERHPHGYHLVVEEVRTVHPLHVLHHRSPADLQVRNPETTHRAGVPNSTENPRFVPQALEHVVVSWCVRVQQLQRNRAGKPALRDHLRAVHIGETARAEQLEDSVAATDGGLQRGLRRVESSIREAWSPNATNDRTAPQTLRPCEPPLGFRW